MPQSTEVDSRERIAPVTLAIGAILVTVGSVLRFHKLGDWSLSDDEVYTLVHALKADGSSGIVNISPISFWLTRLSRWLMPSDVPIEFSTRAVHALLGSLTLAVAGLSIRRISGDTVSLVIVALFAFSPWCLYHSQFARYNSTIILVSLIAGVSYYRYEVLREGRWIWGAVIASLVAALTHPTGAVIPLVLLGDVILFRGVLKDKKRRSLFIKGLGLAAILAAVVLVIRWDDFNNTVIYSIFHLQKVGIDQPADVIQGLVYNLGFQIVLVEFLTLGLVFRAHPSLARFLFVWITLPTVGILLLSFAGVSVAQRYLLTTLPAHMWWVGLGLCELGKLVRDPIQSSVFRFRMFRIPAFRFPTFGLVGIGILCWLPSIISHYADGNRFDFRGAAQFVEEHAGPGSMIIAEQHLLVAHYAGWPESRVIEAPPREIQLSDGRMLEFDDVKTRIQNAKDLWVIIPENHLHASQWKGQFAQWSAQNCRLVKVFYRPRLDYHQNILWVLHRRAG